MKIKSLLMTAFAVCSLAASAQLAETTNLTYAVINEGAINPGDVAYVTMSLVNPDVEYSAVEVHMEYPAGWKAAEFTLKDAGIADKTKKGLAHIIPESRADETDNHNKMSLSAEVPNENPNAFGIVVMSLANETMEKGEDAIVVFAIQVPEDAADGDYEMKIGGPQHLSTGVPGGVGDGDLDDTTLTVSVITAVKDVNANKAVAGKKYYNLAGVESDQPFDGVNVVVTTYTDGTKAASKVIK